MTPLELTDDCVTEPSEVKIPSAELPSLTATEEPRPTLTDSPYAPGIKARAIMKTINSLPSIFIFFLLLPHL
jgi:hypothetical protein